MKKKKPFSNIRIGASIFALIIIGAILLLAQRKYSVNPATSDGVPLDETAPWHLYENSQFGFSLKWPREILPRDPEAYNSGPRAPGYAYIPIHSNLDIFVAMGAQTTGGNMMEATRKYIPPPEEKNYRGLKREPFPLGALSAAKISYATNDDRRRIVILYEDSSMKLILAYQENQPDFDEALFKKVAQTLSLKNPGLAFDNAFAPTLADTDFTLPTSAASISPSSSPLVQTSGWINYRNNEDGYTIRHPADFIVGEGATLLHTSQVVVGTTFSIPSIYIEASRFYSASIHVAAGEKNACAATPEASAYQAGSGAVFQRTEKSEETTGQAFSRVTYKILSGDTCYQFVLLGVKNNPSAVLTDPTEIEDVQKKIEWGEKKLRAIFEAMLGTLSFADAQDSGDSLRVDAVVPSPIPLGGLFTITGAGFSAQPPEEEANIGWFSSNHVTASLTNEAGDSGIVWEGNPTSDTELVATLFPRLCKTAEICEPALELVANETYVLTVAIPYLGRKTSFPVTVQ